MSKILFGENGNEDKQQLINNLESQKTIQNIFQNRLEAQNGKAKFPNWDIVPPSQFINPRIKQ